jgi:hypothetical protein
MMKSLAKLAIDALSDRDLERASKLDFGTLNKNISNKLKTVILWSKDDPLIKRKRRDNKSKNKRKQKHRSNRKKLWTEQNRALNIYHAQDICIDWKNPACSTQGHTPPVYSCIYCHDVQFYRDSIWCDYFFKH